MTAVAEALEALIARGHVPPEWADPAAAPLWDVGASVADVRARMPPREDGSWGADGFYSGPYAEVTR